MKRLDRSFFNRSTVTVAQELLGKVMVFQDYWGIITETEAYIGQGDPACHAARGRTPRCEVLFGPPGYAYVYFIYGMYYCLNIVTEEENIAGAVLLRGLHIQGPEKMLLDGPGKLCRFLGITRDYNGYDMVTSPTFFVEDRGYQYDFQATPRIGISQGKEKLWRFLIK